MQPITPENQTPQSVAQPTQPVSPEIQTSMPQPIISPTPEQPTQPKQKLSKWIIVTVIFLLLLIVGGISAYVLNKNAANESLPSPRPVSIATPTPTLPSTPKPTLTPTPSLDPKADWKTYKNNFILVLDSNRPIFYHLSRIYQ